MNGLVLLGVLVGIYLGGIGVVVLIHCWVERTNRRAREAASRGAGPAGSVGAPLRSTAPTDPSAPLAGSRREREPASGSTVPVHG